MANPVVILSFSGTPLTGATPLVSSFSADVQYDPVTQSTCSVSAYNWCFDYSATPKVWVTTTEPVIDHSFYGVYGQDFDVTLSAGISGTTGGGTLLKTSASYVTISGPEEIRYRQNKDLSLTRFLPGKFYGTETEKFTKFFEDYLNTMFDGIEAIQTSATDITITP